ncbi:MAG: hypothetical protein HOP12_14175 [Candidatus Eisenbacteria bacterium]|uniref:Uncharacterized protein n=1 Tax=Eiseniibacteriota bacterium TaxID=2212470 RepID=A0A849SQR8_UNCEI|nr:hypothetical protein [Candidatus Eisenbacteria bacterium]
MWSTETYWFDATLATGLLMLGHLFFGHFEAHKPRWRLLLKSLLGVAMVLGISATAGRGWTYAFIGLIGVGVVVVHGWWLPKQGVNGWTGEPRARYYELLGLDEQGRRRPRDA